MINFWLNPMVQIILVGCVLVIALIAMAISIGNHLRLKRIMKNCSSGKLDETIIEYYSKVEGLSKELKEGLLDLGRLERNMGLCMQKVGSIRYSAFSDMGSDLSFALAVLDGQDNGVVLNGIYGRENTTVYLKHIAGGASRIPLSPEEKQAIDQARENYKNGYLPKI